MISNFIESLSIILSKKTRGAFGINEFIAVIKTATFYLLSKNDPIYNGHFQKRFENLFSKYMGGGYSRVVNSGTNAIFVAIKSLKIPEGSYVGVTPLVDPGVINAIIIAGFKPLLLDIYSPKELYISLEELKNGIRLGIKAFIVIHYYGFTSPIIDIKKICSTNNVKIIEDCSQCHSGKIFNQNVGTFGEIAIFSTMSRKSLITGASGGIVFTKSLDTFKLINCFADRGKNTFNEGVDLRLCSKNQAVSLNFNSNEFACAIGISSLKRLKKCTQKRIELANYVAQKLEKNNFIYTTNFNSSDCPFIIPLFANKKYHYIIKDVFQRYNIDFSMTYDQCAVSWPWLKPYLEISQINPNAINFANDHILLYIHEGYNKFYFICLNKAFKAIQEKCLKLI